MPQRDRRRRHGELVRPNTDGCDPESCDGVVIDGVTFNTGDDCIAVKSGRDSDGRRVDVPCQNVVIQNCITTMTDANSAQYISGIQLINVTIGGVAVTP